ncbi:MAG: inactive transglutaminase family protein [Desulfotalea sp.]
MKTKLQLIIIIATLLILGIGSAIYKSQELGFSFLPTDKVEIWTVESAVSFTADGGPLEVSLNLPDNSDSLAVLDLINTGKNYEFNIVKGRAIWSGENETGEDKIYFRATVSRHKNGEPIPSDDFPIIKADFSEAGTKAAGNLIKKASTQQKSKTAIATYLLASLNSTENTDARILHDEVDTFDGKLEMACALLGRADIAARFVKGLQLKETQNSKTLKSYIEILDNDKLVLLNPRSSEEESLETFLLWQVNQESTLDLVGATGGKVSFAVLGEKMAAERVAIMHGQHKQSFLIDFSIYSLPIKDQNTFKLLLLIPIGALVVVILRNLVGIPTSGTFMPILIALVFLQTQLVSGLALFIIVVSVGLILRSYLSHLNLLLVPRISAVLVFVIIIYVAISVTSDKMGIDSGMQVTFFPMIIIAWTIERMSVLWEEEGPKDVLKQSSGSLFAASLIYFAMSNKYVGHLTYSFPELLLVVLAIIIMIGSYSGYRLTELRRFEPLVSKE